MCYIKLHYHGVHIFPRTALILTRVLFSAFRASRQGSSASVDLLGLIHQAEKCDTRPTNPPLHIEYRKERKVSYYFLGMTSFAAAGAIEHVGTAWLSGMWKSSLQLLLNLIKNQNVDEKHWLGESKTDAYMFQERLQKENLKTVLQKAKSQIETLDVKLAKTDFSKGGKQSMNQMERSIAVRTRSLETVRAIAEAMITEQNSSSYAN